MPSMIGEHTMPIVLLQQTITTVLTTLPPYRPYYYPYFDYRSIALLSASTRSLRFHVPEIPHARED